MQTSHGLELRPFSHFPPHYMGQDLQKKPYEQPGDKTQRIKGLQPYCLTVNIYLFVSPSYPTYPGLLRSISSQINTTKSDWQEKGRPSLSTGPTPHVACSEGSLLHVTSRLPSWVSGQPTAHPSTAHGEEAPEPEAAGAFWVQQGAAASLW